MQASSTLRLIMLANRFLSLPVVVRVLGNALLFMPDTITLNGSPYKLISDFAGLF